MPTIHNGPNKLDLARILEKSSNLSSLDIAFVWVQKLVTQTLTQ